MDKPIRRTSHFAPLMVGAVLGVWLSAPSAPEAANTLDALSSKQAADGLRAALSQGVGRAVTQLGAKNGFLNDPKVAVPLPSLVTPPLPRLMVLLKVVSPDPPTLEAAATGSKLPPVPNGGTPAEPFQPAMRLTSPRLLIEPSMMSELALARLRLPS